MSISLNNHAIVDVSSIRTKYEIPLYANTAVLRAGREPSDFWIVTERRWVDEVTATDTQSFLTVSLPYETDGDTEEVYSKLSYIKASSIVPSYTKYEDVFANKTTKNLNQLMVAHFKDGRHHLRQGSITKLYNVVKGIKHTPGATPSQSFNFLEGTLNSSNPWTWAEVVTDLINSLSEPSWVDATDFVSPEYYLKTGESHDNDTGLADDEIPRYPFNVRFYGVNPWDALCDFLSVTGHTIVPIKDGTFKVVSCRELQSHNVEAKKLIEKTGSVPATGADEFVYTLDPAFDANNDVIFNPVDLTINHKEDGTTRVINPIHQIGTGKLQHLPESWDVYFPARKYRDTTGLAPEEAYEIGPYHKVTVTTAEALAITNNTAVSNYLTTKSTTETGKTETLYMPYGYYWPSNVSISSTEQSTLLVTEIAKELALREISHRVGDLQSYSFPYFPRFQPDQLYPLVELNFAGDGRFETSIFGSINTFASLADNMVDYVQQGTAPQDFYKKTPPQPDEYTTNRPSAKWMIGVVDAQVLNNALGTASLQYTTIDSATTGSLTDSGTNATFVNFSGATLSSGDKVRLEYDYQIDSVVVLPGSGSSSEGGGGSGEDHPHMIVSGKGVLCETNSHLQIRAVEEYLGMSALNPEPKAATNPKKFWGADKERYLLTPGGYTVWVSDEEYEEGDLVTFLNVDGSTALYEANQDNQEVTFSDSDWTLLEIIDYQDWQASTAYASADYVKNDVSGLVSIWKAGSGFTSHATALDETKDWVFQGYYDAPAWIADNAYGSGEIVKMPDPSDLDGPQYFWSADSSTNRSSWTEATTTHDEWTKGALAKERENDWHVAGIVGPHEPVEGLVSAYTAAIWNNSSDTFTTVGSVSAYPLSKEHTIDRDADVLVREHHYTFDIEEGANVMWTKEKVIVLTCEAVDGWS